VINIYSVYLICICFLVLSCSHEKKITPDVASADQSLNGAGESSPNENASEKIFKGLFVVGKNGLSFRECEHPEKDFLVADSTLQLKQLYKSVFLHTPAFPNEYVYVEVRGELSAASESMKTQGIDSILTVKKVLTIEQKNYENSCIPYDFWAIGSNWSLQISMKEGVMVLKDLSEMKVYVFEYFPPKTDNDEVFTYSSNNYAMQASIKAVITKQSCTDSSGNQSPYSASVLVNGKRYSGCAVQGTSIK